MSSSEFIVFKESSHIEFRLGDQHIHIAPIFDAGLFGAKENVWWVWHSDYVSLELLEKTLDYYKDEPEIVSAILATVV